MNTFENNIFFRGFSFGDSASIPFVGKVRKDRAPRNMPLDIHRRADKWFEAKFGIKYRSQSLFLSGSFSVSRGYASSDNDVFRILPLDSYKFCWSPKYFDLLGYLPSGTGLSVEEYLEKGDYQETGLDDAKKSGHEVMLYCDEYIAVPYSAQNINSNTFDKSGIILFS
jgi:hypothetical protein